MWSELIEVIYFFLIIAIAITAGFTLFPIFQAWTIVLAAIILLVGSIIGYWLFEAQREETKH
jgi:hypothetical protein